MRTLSVFGSTGSVGKSCLEVIRSLPESHFKILALVANDNYQELANQAVEFSVALVVIKNEQHYKALKELLSHTSIRVTCGEIGIQEACSLKSDLVVAAISGIAGLTSVYSAILEGSDILLANKESLVCAGNIVMSLARQKKVNIIPVDSEHNAIYQVFDKSQRESVNKIILTASGGPFRGKSKNELQNISVAEALNHPTWKMGKKITIDSATMFNKGLEVIEAYYLFDMKVEDIEVIIHPQSVIHSMVEYKDGSILAQLSQTDMKVPILNALYYPGRYQNQPIIERINFARIKALTFEQVDNEVFPAINYAREAVEKGGAAQVIFNSSNEVLVENFLENKIRFYDIFDIVAEMLSESSLYKQQLHTINDIMLFDKYCREVTYGHIQNVI